LIILGEGKGLYGRKGLERKCGGKNSKKVENAWARREREFGQGFTVLMLYCGMGPQYLCFYEKMIVIQFGDGI
jgi:hypothetical protein